MRRAEVERKARAYTKGVWGDQSHLISWFEGYRQALRDVRRAVIAAKLPSLETQEFIRLTRIEDK